MNQPIPAPGSPADSPAPAPSTTAPQAPSPGAAPWAQQAAAGTPWARSAAPAKPRATERLRRTIEGLPDWEPLPPGEILVRRGDRDT